MRLGILGSAAATLFVSAPVEAASTITFDNMGFGANTQVGGTPVAIGSGFQIAVANPGPSTAGAIVDDYFSGLGYVASGDSAANSSVVLNMLGGNAFSLNSFQYAGYNNNYATSITVTGTKTSGGTVTTTLNIDPLAYYVSATANLTGFNDLTSVSFLGNLNFSQYGFLGVGVYSLDNINVAPTTAVPESTTWTMMLLGFGGMGLAMRRRRSALFQVA